MKVMTGRFSPSFRLTTGAAALAVAGMSATLSSAIAQTVDCIDPIGPVAQQICNDPELADLDLTLGEAFREVIRSTPRNERPSVLRAQRDWLEVRDDCFAAGNARECLRASMERRISDLSQGLAGTITAEPQGVVREPVEQEALPSLADDRPALPGTSDPNGPFPPRVRTQDDTPLTAGTPQADSSNSPPLAAPSRPAPDDDADAQEIAEFLSSSVWRAEITSGIRPGTIYVFHSNGLLITADCVESYRIGSWRVEGAGLRMEDGSGGSSTAEIVESGDGFVRLKLTERGNRPLDLVFRPARGPFACTSSR